MEVDKSELYRLITRTFPRSMYDDVHDVMQVSIVQTWLRRAMKEPPVNQQAYASAIAKRLMSKLVHHRNRFVYPDRETMRGWETLQEERGCLVHEQSTDESLDIQRVLKVLPEHYAYVLRRHYLEGISLRQIADELCVTAPAMRKRHQRALQLAREYVGNGARSPVEDP